MPWELEIHIIDVGQGESSLIIARNPAAAIVRSMLIDGGLDAYSQIVHDYVTDPARGLARLDYIVISHFDKDHFNGLCNLLEADNLCQLCSLLASAAGQAAYACQDLNRPFQIAAGAAAINAVLMGAYNTTEDLQAMTANTGPDYSLPLQWVRDYIAPLPIGDAPDQEAADAGVDAWDTNRGVIEARFAATPHFVAGHYYNPSILFAGVTHNRVVRQGSEQAAITGAGQAARTRAAFDRIYDLIKGQVNPYARIKTNGFYKESRIIHLGSGTSEYQDVYGEIFEGRFGTTAAKTAPGLLRKITNLSNPNDFLGQEVLWRWNPPAPLPANYPRIRLLAANRLAWFGDKSRTMGPMGGDPNWNSIVLLLIFGNFCYYTGGDLPNQDNPADGEMLIANTVMRKVLPGEADHPESIACFKCGHHGSQHSTSATFINLIQPAAAFISCGENTFGSGEEHPTQSVIDNLHNAASIRNFYLTNCIPARTHVPGSHKEGSQVGVPGNKSRVAGDNEENNLADNRHRGNIILTISEAEANAVGAARQFHVTYWEGDDGMGDTTDDIPY